MASVESAGALPSAQAGIFDREHTVAKAGFNRWLVPPAALVDERSTTLAGLASSPS